MTSTTNRKRGAIAAVLDTDALVVATRAALTATDSTLDVSQVHVDRMAPHMLIESKDGRAAVVNVEGVGAFEDEGTVTVWATEGFGSFPVEVPVTAIVEAATDEEIDLADGIRTFGARLDSNHHLWWLEYRGRYTG